jgi:hypothetical protein
MDIFGRDLSLEERLRVEAALADAYAPLRERRAAISPARVRARVRWETAPQPAAAWQGVALVARLSEATVAFAVSALFFVGALGITEAPRSVSDDAAPRVEATFVSRAFDPSQLVDDPNYLRVQSFAQRVLIDDSLDASRAPAITLDAAGAQGSVGVR